MDHRYVAAHLFHRLNEPIDYTIRQVPKKEEEDDDDDDAVDIPSYSD